MLIYYQSREKGAMGMFDIIVLLIIGLLTIMGFFSGMVKQIFGLVGVVAGYMLAMRYYQLCSKYLTTFHPGTAKALSFIAIFLACIIVAHIIGWAVGRLLHISGLGFLNRIGGGLLGFAKGYLIMCVMVIVLTAFFAANGSLFRKSHTIRYIQPATSMLKKVSRDDIKAKYDEMIGKEKPVPPKQKPRSAPAQ
jgi:membrane protein required for colicin V production